LLRNVVDRYVKSGCKEPDDMSTRFLPEIRINMFGRSGN
jgi:hypothetical protein